MAVVFDPNKQDNQNPTNQTQQVTNPGVVGAPTSSPPQSSPSDSSNSSTPTGTSSGRFTNLTNYLSANKDFNNGQGLGGKVASNISDKGDQVTQNVAAAVNNFNTQSGQQVNQAQQGQQLATQAIVNPSNFVNNQNNVAAVQNTINAAYTGPKSLQDLSGNQNQAALQSQANDLNTQTQQGQTESGRFNLLRQMFNKPSYSSGQQNLDNLLIQGNSDQLQKIADTRKTSGAVNQNLNNQVAATQAQGVQAQQNVQAARDATRNTLNQGITDQNTNIQKELTDNTAKRNADYTGTQSQLQNGAVNASLAQKLGLTNGENLYNLDLNSYLTKGNDLTAQQVATGDQYNNLSALGKMLGNASSEQNQQILSQFSDPTKSLAATTQPDAYSFDQNRFNTDKAAQENQFSTQNNFINDRIQEAAAKIRSGDFKGTDILKDGQRAWEFNKIKENQQALQALNQKYNLSRVLKFLQDNQASVAPSEQNDKANT